MVAGIGPTINWGAGCSFSCDALVKGIGRDWIANALSRRSRIVDSVSAADDRFGTEPVRNADARRKIGLIRTYRPSAHTQA